MYVQSYFDNYDCHFCCSGNSAAPLKKQKPLKSVESIPLKLIKIYFQGGDTADTVFWSTRSDISPF